MTFFPTVLRCDPKLFEKDLTDQVYIVTGANSGCGLETSRQLCKQNATVILACRNKSKGEEAAKDINDGNGNGNKAIFLTTLDLSSLDSVYEFCTTFQNTYKRLDGLITNAGVMACPYATTKDGFEWQFGCNHLSHFALMNTLTPLLIDTSKKYQKPSRFVALSSVAATVSTMRPDTPANIDFEDIMWKTRTYDEGQAYAQSKLANYLHAYEASKRYKSTELLCTSVHPGWVYSPLDQHVFKKLIGDGMIANVIGKVFRQLFLWKGDMIMPVDGAQTTLHCLLENSEKIQNGEFYSQFGIYQNESQKPGGWPMKLQNPNVDKDPDTMSSKLWDISLELINQQKQKQGK